MTIPDYQTLMRPVLAHLRGGEVVPSRAVKDAIADVFRLTEDERAQMLPSGRHRTIDSRVSWALTYLTQAGLVRHPRRGSVCITAEGSTALAENPERIDNGVLARYPAFVEFTTRARVPSAGRGPAPAQTGARSPDAAAAGITSPADLATPADLLDQAVATNRAAVETEVLQSALALSPTGFEELVIRLLERMGYGRAGSVERTSASGDAGVDGIISQDPLGLDRIYVQAKRYAEDRAIDRPRIHEFAGALLGKQGDRGVYITTSRFTPGAQQEAERINARIELIDGTRLAELLVRYGVGVQEEQTVTLVRLDEDFFETL